MQFLPRLRSVASWEWNWTLTLGLAHRSRRALGRGHSVAGLLGACSCRHWRGGRREALGTGLVRLLLLPLHVRRIS